MVAYIRQVLVALSVLVLVFQAAAQNEKGLSNYLKEHYPQWQAGDVVTADLVDSIFRLPYTIEYIEVRREAASYLAETEQYSDLAFLTTHIAEILVSNDRPLEAQQILFEVMDLIPEKEIGAHGLLESALGVSFDLTNDLGQCVQFFRSSIEKFNKDDELRFEQVVPLGNLIFLYEEQALYDLALALNTQAMALGREMPAPQKHYNLAYDYATRASLLTSLGLFDSVAYYFDLATQQAQQTSAVSPKVFVKTMAIESYLEQGDLESVRQYVVDDPVAEMSALDRPDVRDHYLVKAARFYIADGTAEKATPLIQLIEVPLSTTAKVDYYTTLQAYYFELGNLKQARHATDSLSKYSAQSDQEHRENNLALASLELEREQLNEQTEIAAQKRRRQNIALVGMSALLALLAWSLWVLYRSNRERERINKALSLTHEALVGKNQELERYIRSNIQLERFAHIAAHDLKAPLRTIASFTGLLKRKISGRLDDKEHTYLAFIERSTSSMGALIDDLLMYSKANSQSLDITKVHLATVVQEGLRQLQYQISEKGATIKTSNCDITFFADALKLRQVLQNLISNALKFHKETEPPEISISAQTSNGMIQICVSDNGIGIDPEFHNEVFESFKTLHSQDEFEGTGMGLAICKEIVEKHGGQIWVDSIPGFGSSFYFTVSDEAQQASGDMGKQLRADLN
ncbi:MAG: GHKL domain-containing protein [Saprospiraceae bacterium]|nr:GHKL domain-containing protein [Saprospiraceae bacterium]